MASDKIKIGHAFTMDKYQPLLLADPDGLTSPFECDVNCFLDVHDVQHACCNETLLDPKPPTSTSNGGLFCVVVSSEGLHRVKTTGVLPTTRCDYTFFNMSLPVPEAVFFFFFFFFYYWLKG